MRSVILIVIALTMSEFIVAQERIDLPITLIDGEGYFKESSTTSFRQHPLWQPENNPLLAKCLPILKGTPPAWRDVYTDFIWFDIKQFVYQSWKQHKLNNDEFAELSKSLKIDLRERSFSDQAIKCFMAVAVGKTSAGELRYKLDMNHNLTFSDDKIQAPEASTAALKRLHPNDGKDTVVYEAIRQGAVVKLKVQLVVQDKDDEKILINISQHAQAEIDGEKIYASSAGFASTNYDYAELLVVKEVLYNQYKDKIYETEFFTINGNNYQFLGIDISRMILKLKKVRNDTTLYGTHVGLYAPLFKGQDLDNKPVAVSDYQGKYLFLEFWSTDDFDLMNYMRYMDLAYWNRNKLKVDFLSCVTIAESDLASMPGVVTQHKRQWKQMVINDQKAIYKDYDVYSFPMNFLLDPQGKILIKNIDVSKISSVILHFTR